MNINQLQVFLEWKNETQSYQIESVYFDPKEINSNHHLINNDIITGKDFFDFQKVKDFLYGVLTNNGMTIDKDNIIIEPNENGKRQFISSQY